MLHEGKTLVITGCNRGIGLEILKKFSIYKCHIFACIRSPDKDIEKNFKDLEARYGCKIKIIKLDLNDLNSIKSSFEEIKSSKKKVDILINNAGILNVSLFQMYKYEDLKRIFEVNFFNTFEFTKLIIKIMSYNSESSIINMSSISAYEANMGRFSYSTSKAATVIATKNLSQELSRLKIRVNSVSPGLIDTKMLRDFTSDEQIKKRLESCALKRLGKPEEIANVVLFLASNLSSYINGQDLIVDGGSIK